MCFSQGRGGLFAYSAFFVLVLFFLPAQSGGPCQGTTPLELSECLEKQYHEQDSILNATYRATMNEIAVAYKRNSSEIAKNKEQLKAMQKQWIVSRDQHCLFVSQIAAVDTPANGNQLHQSTFSELSCKTEYTKERIRQLQEIIAALENR